MVVLTLVTRGDEVLVPLPMAVVSSSVALAASLGVVTGHVNAVPFTFKSEAVNSVRGESISGDKFRAKGGRRLGWALGVAFADLPF